ncbi:hypothetical protein N9937_02180 [bacterium]|nr:hypothetical protein [bacterium]
MAKRPEQTRPMMGQPQPQQQGMGASPAMAQRNQYVQALRAGPGGGAAPPQSQGANASMNAQQGPPGGMPGGQGMGIPKPNA